MLRTYPTTLGLALLLSAGHGGCADTRDSGESEDGAPATDDGLVTAGAAEAGEADDDAGVRLDIDDGQGSAEGDAPSRCGAVDLLFVIDNSGSMADEQANLVASFDGFISGIRSELSDQTYHVGVVSTDAYEGNAAGCDKLGALVTQTAGQESSDSVCGPWGSGRFMTENDDVVSGFACAAQIGTGGAGDEKPMQAVVNALLPEIGGNESCNDNFLRDDALLVLVIITDEEDDHESSGCAGEAPNEGSNGDPDRWFARAVEAKQGRQESVVVLSLVGPNGPEPAACDPLDKCGADKITGAEPATRIEEFTRRFRFGFVGRVCDPSYGEFFTQHIGEVVNACDIFPPQG